ncbi:unnamed protein product, partial [Closterium sp. Naga37s-1]
SGFYPLLPLAEPSADGVGDVLMGEAVRGCMQAAAHEGDVNGQKRLLSAAAFGRAFCRSGFYPLLPLAEPSADGVGDVLMGEAVRGCMQAAAHEGDVNGQKRLLSAAAFGRAFCRSGFYPLLPLAEPSADGVGDVLMGEAVRGCMQAAAHEGDVNGQKRLLSAAAFGRAFCRSGFYPLLPLAEPSADGVGDVLMGEAVRGCMQAAAHEGDVNGQKRLLSAAAFGRAFCRSGFYPLLPLAEPSADGVGDVLMGEAVRGCMQAAAHEGDVNGQKRLLSAAAFGRAFCRSGFYPLLPLAEPSADGVGDVLMGEAVRGCMQAAAHEGDVNGQKRLLSAAAFGRAFCRSGFYPLLPLAEPSADGVGDVLMGEAVRGCMQAAAHEGDVNGQKRLLSAAAFGRAFCRSGFYPLLPLAEPSADGVGDVLMGEAVRGCMQAAAHEGDVNGQKRLLSAAAFGRAFCRSGFYPLLPLAEPSADGVGDVLMGEAVRGCMQAAAHEGDVNGQKRLLSAAAFGRAFCRSGFYPLLPLAEPSADGVGDVLMGEAVRGCMQAAAHEGDVNGQKRLLSAAAFGRAFCRSGFYPLLPLAEPSADGVGDVLMGEAVRGCMQAAAHEGDVNGQKRLLSAAAFGRAFCRSGFYPLLPLAEPSADGVGDVLMGEAVRGCMQAAAHEGDVNGQKRLLSAAAFGRAFCRSGFYPLLPLAEPSADGVGDVLMGEAVRGCMQAAAHEGDVNGQKRLLSAAAFGRAFCRSGFYPLLPLAEPSADGVGDVLMGEAVRGCMQAAAHEGDVNGQKRLLSAAAFGRAFCRSGFYPLLPLAEPSADGVGDVLMGEAVRGCMQAAAHEGDVNGQKRLLSAAAFGRAFCRSGFYPLLPLAEPSADGVGDVLMGEAVRGCMQAAAHEGDVNGQKRLLSAAAFGRAFCRSGFYPLLPLAEPSADGVGDVLMGEAVRGCMQAAAHEGDVNGQKRLLSAAAFGRAFCRSGFYPLLPLAEPSADGVGDVLMGEAVRGCMQAAAHEGDVNGQKRLLSAAAFGRAFCRSGFYPLLPLAEPSADGVGDVLMGEAVRGCMQAAAHEGDVNGQKRLLSAAAFGRAFCRSGFYPLLPLAEPSADGVGDVLMGEAVRGCMQAAAHEGDVNGQKRLLSAAAFGRAFCRSGFYPLLPLAEPSADGVGDVLMGEAVRGCMQAAAHEGDVNGQKRLLSAAAFGRAFCRSGFYPLLPLAEPSADGVGDVLMGEAVRGCMQAAAHEGDVNGQKRLLSAAAFGRAFCRSGFYPLLPLAEPSADGVGDVLMGEAVRGCMQAAAHEGDVNGQKRLLSAAAFGRAFCRSGFYPLLPLAEPSADGVGDVLMGEAVRGCMQAAAHEGDVNGQKRLLSAAAFGRAFCRSGFYPLLPLAEPSADGVGDVLMGEAVRGCMQAAAHEGDVNGQKRLLSAAAFGRAFCRSGFYPLLPLAEPSADGVGDVLMGEAVRGCMQAAAHEGDVNGQKRLLSAAAFGRAFCRSGFYPLLPLAEPSADGVGDVLMGEAVRGCMQAAAHEGDVNGQKRLLSAAAFGRAFCRSGFYPLLPLAEPSADGVGDVLMGEAVRGCMQAAAHEGDVNGQKRLLSAAAFGRAFCRSGFYPLLPLAEPSADGVGDVLMGEAVRGCMQAAAHEGDVNGQKRLLSAAAFGRAFCRSGFYPLLPLAEPSADGVGDVLMGEAVRGCMQAAAHEGDVNGQKRLLSAAAFGRAFCRSGFYPLLPLAEPSADGVGDVLMGEAVRGCMQAAAHEGDVNGQKRLLSAAAFGRAFCRSGFYPLLPLAEPSADGVGDVLMGEAVRGCMQAAAHEGDVNGQKRLLSAAAFGRAFCRSGFYPLLPLAEPSADGVGDVLMGEAVRGCMQAAAHEGDVNGQKRLLSAAAFGRAFCRSGFYPLLPLAEPSADGVGDVLMGEAVRGCMQAAAHEGDVNGQKRLLSAAAFGRAFCRSGFYPLLPLAEPSADGVGDVLMGEAVRGCMQAAAHEGDVNGQKRLLSAAAFGRAFCRSGFYPLLPLAEPSADGVGDVLMGEAVRGCMQAAAHEGDVNGQKRLLSAAAFGRAFCRSGFYPLLPLAEPSADGVGDVLMGEAVRGCMQAAAHEGDVNGQKRLLSAAAFGRAFCRSGFYPLLPLAEPSADGVGDVLMGEAVRGCMQAAAHEGDVNGQKRLLSAAAFGRAFCRSGFYPLLPLAEPSADGVGDVLMGEAVRGCMQAAAHEGDVNGQKRLLSAAAFGRAFCRSGFYPLLPLAEPSADGVGDVLMGEAVRGCMQAAAHEGDVNGQKRLLSAAAFGRAFCRSGFYPLLPLAEPSADGVGDVLMGEAVRGCMQAAAHEGDVNGQKRLLSAAAFGRAFCRSGFYPLLPLAEPSADGVGDVLMGEAVRGCMQAAAHEGDVNGQKRLLSAAAFGRAFCRSGFYPLLPLAEPSADGVGDVLMGEAVRGCMQAAAHEGDVNGQKRLLSAAAFGRAFCRSGFYPLLPLAEPSADGVGDVLMGEAVRGCMQAAAHEGDVNGQKRLLSAAAFGRAFCRSGFYPLLPLAEPSADGVGDVLMGEAVRGCMQAAAHEGDVNGQKRLLSAAAFGRAFCRSGFYPLLPLAEPSADGVGDVLMGEAVRGCMQAAAHEGDVNGQKRLLSAAAFGRAFCRSGFYPLLPLAEPSADGVGDVLMGEAVRGCMQAAAHEGDVNGQKRLLSAAAFGRAFCRSGFYPLLPLAEPSADGVGDVLMGEAVRGCMQAAAHEGDVNGQKRLLSAAAFGRAFCRSGFYPLLPLAEPSADGVGDVLMGEAVRGCMQAAAHEGDVNGQKRLLSAAAFGRAFCRSGFYPLLPLAEPSADGVGDVLMGEAVRGCMQAAAHEGDVNGQKRLLSAAAFGRAFCRSGFYPLLPLAEPSADGVGDVLMGEAVRGCMQAAAHEGDVNGQKRLLSAAAFGRAFCRSGFYPLLPLAEPSADGVGDVLMGEAVRGCMQAAAHEGDVNGQKRLLSAAAFGRAFCRLQRMRGCEWAEAASIRCCLWQSLLQAAAHEGDVNGQKRLLSAAAFGRAFCRSGFYPLLPLAEPSAEAASIRCCLWQSLLQAAAHEGDVNGQKRLLSAAAFGRAFAEAASIRLLPFAEPLQVSQDGRSRVRSDGVGDVLMGEAVLDGCMQAAAHEGDVNGQKRLLSAAAFGRAFCR